MAATPAVAVPSSPGLARQPWHSTLYQVVRDNVATLYRASEEGFGTPLPKFVRAELDGYLGCQVLGRGFAHLECKDCGKPHLLAFCCGGRGFCPSCTGRRMAQTAANLTQFVLPDAPLRQWVLMVPYALRSRIAYDRRLLSRLYRIFYSSIQRFYERRLAQLGQPDGRTGSVTAIQRASSDLRLNPHLHGVFLDGVYVQDEQGELSLTALPALSELDVQELLQSIAARMLGYLRRHGLLTEDDTALAATLHGDDEQLVLEALATAAVSGTSLAGPQSRPGRVPYLQEAAGQPTTPSPLCAAYAGFSLHARTTVEHDDKPGRQRLIKYILRPPLAAERVERLDGGRVRLRLKRASPTALGPSRWTSCLWSPGSQRWCRHPGKTRCATAAYFPRPAHGALALCPSRQSQSPQMVRPASTLLCQPHSPRLPRPLRPKARAFCERRGRRPPCGQPVAQGSEAGAGGAAGELASEPSGAAASNGDAALASDAAALVGDDAARPDAGRMPPTDGGSAPADATPDRMSDAAPADSGRDAADDAAPPAPHDAGDTPSACSDRRNVLLLFDRSASMQDAWLNSGLSRLAAAQQAVQSALAAHGAPLTIGALFFPTAACVVQLPPPPGGAVAPIGEAPQIDFQQSAAAFSVLWSERFMAVDQAMGIGTPLDEAFDRADVALGAAALSGSTAIVLISDGDGNCLADAQQSGVPSDTPQNRVATWLAQGIEVHLISLASMATPQLDAIAAAAGVSIARPMELQSFSQRLGDVFSCR